MDNRLCIFLYLGTKTGRQGLPSQDPSPARGQMPPFKGGERSLLSKCLRPNFYSNSGHVCLVISSPPNEQELGELTLSNYDSNENANCEFGEITMSNYDFNENADNEPSESEDSDDELVFNSDASVSEDNEVENEEEVLVKEELVKEELVEEELVEEDAKILIYLTQLYKYKYVIII